MTTFGNLKSVWHDWQACSDLFGVDERVFSEAFQKLIVVLRSLKNENRNITPDPKTGLYPADTPLGEKAESEFVALKEYLAKHGLQE